MILYIAMGLNDVTTGPCILSLFGIKVFLIRLHITTISLTISGAFDEATCYTTVYIMNSYGVFDEAIHVTTIYHQQLWCVWWGYIWQYIALTILVYLFGICVTTMSRYQLYYRVAVLKWVQTWRQSQLALHATAVIIISWLHLMLGTHSGLCWINMGDHSLAYFTQTRGLGPGRREIKMFYLESYWSCFGSCACVDRIHRAVPE